MDLEELERAAKAYAGFTPDCDPNSEEERYYSTHKCDKYDAFISGAKFVMGHDFIGVKPKPINEIVIPKCDVKDGIGNQVAVIAGRNLGRTFNPEFIETIKNLKNEGVKLIVLDTLGSGIQDKSFANIIKNDMDNKALAPIAERLPVSKHTYKRQPSRYGKGSNKRNKKGKR